MKKAFTMIELIFVVVVLGILSAVALPKFAKSGENARLAKAQGDISAIRTSVLNERTKRLLRGSTIDMTKISSQTTTADGDPIFDGNGSSTVMSYPLISGSSAGHWRKTAAFTYAFNVDGSTNVIFTYHPATGRFDCNRAAAGYAGKFCKRLSD